MKTVTVTVHHESGLHARPAAQFVKLAKQFDSDIKISTNGKSVNAKSLVLLLTLAVKPNTSIELAASGTDEQEAVDALSKLIERDFAE